MGKVAPPIIYDSQIAYVPGGDINFNNRMFSYIVNKVDNNEDEIVSIDAEKTFDSVSHVYIKETFNKCSRSFTLGIVPITFLFCTYFIFHT